MEMFMRILLLVVACMLLSSVTSADCVTDSRGRTVCSNGEKAAVVNKKGVRFIPRKRISMA